MLVYRQQSSTDRLTIVCTLETSVLKGNLQDILFHECKDINLGIVYTVSKLYNESSCTSSCLFLNSQVLKVDFWVEFKYRRILIWRFCP